MPTWTNETRISSTTQPFFYADFFGIPISNKKPATYTLDRTQILDASIEGKAPKARRGSFRFIDPTGEWPQILANAGAYSNSIEGKGFPNLMVYFGWQGLSPNDSSTEEITKLSGLILKTRFSVDQDTAMTTIEVEYIEAIMSWFSNLRFLDANDMIILDQLKDETNNRELKNMPVGDLLTYIWENSSIKADVETSGADISINFEQTGDDAAIDGRKYKIRFGDSFQSKINEISAQAKYTVEGQNDDPDIAYSYERIDKEDELIINDSGFEYKASITYGWKPAPMGESEPDTNIDSAWNRPGAPEIIKGPNLLWKKQSKDANSKTMITWDSDLNSKEYLIHQAQDELTKTLSQYSDSDWNALQEFIKLAREEGGSQIDQSGISAAYKRLEQQAGTGGAKQFFGRIFGDASWDMTDENRMQMVETLIKETDKASGNPAAQMSAIIANNVFKGKATILGDPKFGTELLPYQIKLTMIFEDVGEFATLFQRDWLLTNVVHKFAEGSYITELELLTYPEQNQSMATESALNELGTVRRDSSGRVTGL